MTIVSPMGQLRPVFADKNGKRLSGGKVFTYEPGTLTPKATYTDALNLIPNTNPIDLDKYGEADIFLNGDYRIRVVDRHGTLIDDYDNLMAWATKRYLDSALSGFASGANNFYPTLADANADISNIAVNQVVNIGELENGGLWYKESTESTTLTKTPYDAFELSKQYSNQKQVVQEQYINDLFSSQTQYVNELINQQGVSLQQLDSYYNYLMSRIAAIAVDKGWDASFVVDASGKTQQQINDGLSSIAEMLAIRNPKNGSRFFVVGYHAGSILGGGEFIYSKTSTLAADQGIVFDCPDGGKWIRLHKGTVSFDDYGAKRDGTDQSAAIESAVTNVYCRRIEQSGGEFIVTRTFKKMLPGTDVKMHPGSLIKIVSLAGGVRLFMPADRCNLELQIDGNQFPISGGIKGDWVGSNNRAVASLADGYSYPFDGNYNVKNVKVRNSWFINIAEPIRNDGAVDWLVTGNYFENVKQSCCLMGASNTSPVRNNKFSHNTSINVGDTACATFQLTDHPNSKISGVQMTNNFAMNTQMRTMGWAFDFEGVSNPGDCRDGIIANNIIFQLSSEATLDSAARGGAVAGENCSNIQILGNAVIGPGLGYGININRSINSSVKLNTVYGYLGGGTTLIGSVGADVDSNKYLDCGGATVNAAVIAVMLPTWDFVAYDFTVQNNKIKNGSDYIRVGASPAIAIQPASTVVASNVGGVIRNNKIVDANGTGILINTSNATPISGILLEDNTIHSAQGNMIFQITNATDIIVDGIKSRGCSRFRVTNCLTDVLLKNMDIVTTGNAAGVLTSQNVTIENSRLRTSGSFFEDTSQFTDASKNNRLKDITGGIRTQNKGLSLDISSGGKIQHGLGLTPNSVSVTPTSSGITALAVTATTATDFTVTFTGAATSKFYWEAQF